MHHPTDTIIHTRAFVKPVVDHWLEREIAQWVHPMKDRTDYPSHHERNFLTRSYISLQFIRTCVSLDFNNLLNCTIFARFVFSIYVNLSITISKKQQRNNKEKKNKQQNQQQKTITTTQTKQQKTHPNTKTAYIKHNGKQTKTQTQTSTDIILKQQQQQHIYVFCRSLLAILLQVSERVMFD